MKNTDKKPPSQNLKQQGLGLRDKGKLGNTLIQVIDKQIELVKITANI